ncbi:hypothetical protein ACIGO9_28515 [Nocardia asteroides]|uniref:hypothetical protein n=1 Tax=Nocardia asteroides TaxID=1824 RepID=UPI0037C8D7F4
MINPDGPAGKLHAAIRDLVADATGVGLATDWILLSAYVEPTGPGTGYHLQVSGGLPYHSAIGLANQLNDAIFDAYTDQGK